jgi:hypothetical protein
MAFALHLVHKITLFCIRPIQQNTILSLLIDKGEPSDVSTY